MDRNTHLTNGGCMVTADGRTLPLRGATLLADAKAGLARVTLTQRFYNSHAEPLQVTYQMPLPSDAAVSGFSFVIGDKRVVGEVDLKHKARARFEEALLEGRTAALLDQERSSLFTQSVGNIPPHTEVVSELVIDQKLAFLSDGCWEWRFPTVVAPRYLGASGRVADAAKVTVDVADAALPVRLSLGLSIRDVLPDGARPESPSHALHTEKGVQRFDVSLGSESGASLDRDVVVRWRAGALSPGVELDVARPVDGAAADAADAAYGLVTLIPPLPAAKMQAVPRDLILLLDTSGSMSGGPLAQMQRVASALVDSLNDDDMLEMVSFANSTQRWRWRPQLATASSRKDAQAWISKLQAGGGTEMREGILEALKPLRQEAQRQVVLMTDGLIGFESEIVQAICERLPEASRVHTVGIGSGVNRSLTQPSARAGRGVELIIGLDEDPERGAQRIVARTNAPLVTKVEIFGSAVDGVAPQRPCDLFGGAPALCSLKLKAHGGEIVVRGQTAAGPYEQRLTVKPVERGEGSQALAKLYAREQVEDLETELAAGLRDRHEIDRRISSLGVDFQISTRLTSWIAVSPEATVDPRAPKRSVNQPQELPYGMSAEGLGLRAAPAAPGGAVTLTRAGVLKQSIAMDIPRSRAAAVGGAPADKAKKADLSRDFDDEGAADRLEAPAEEPEAEMQGEGEDESFEEQAESRPPPPAAAPKGFAGPMKAPARELARRRKDEATGSGARPVRKFKARLTRLDGRLVLTFTIEGDALVWRPDQVIVDGKQAIVDSAHTTTDGTYSAGIGVTLVIGSADLPPSFTEVFVLSHGELIQLELER